MRQPKQNDPQFKLRLRAALKTSLEVSAATNNRSVNAEIVSQLECASISKPLTAAHLADALGCFWNASIGTAHNRESSAAMDVASVMAEGFAAIADRLAGSPPVLHASMLAALVAAERFISGFEGDELQEGVDELLATVRAAIGGAA